VRGRRDVDDPLETYDESYWFAQVISMPVPRVYLSVSYRDRKRTYTEQTNPLAREVARPQWTGFGSVKLTKNLNASMYYSREVSRSPLVYRRFRTSFLLLGLTVHF